MAGLVHVGAMQTSVNLPGDLPSIAIHHGVDKTTLDFRASFVVNWSTRICGPFGGIAKCEHIDLTLNPNTTITISGSIKLDRDSAGRFYLQVANLTGEAQGPSLWEWWAIDPTITRELQKRLDADNNNNGVADLKEPWYLDQYPAYSRDRVPHLHVLVRRRNLSFLAHHREWHSGPQRVVWRSHRRPMFFGHSRAPPVALYGSGARVDAGEKERQFSAMVRPDQEHCPTAL